MNYYSFMFYSTDPRTYALKLQSELKIDLWFWQLQAFSVLLNVCRRGYWAAFKFCNGTYCTPVFSTNVRLFSNDKNTLTYSAGAPIIAKKYISFSALSNLDFSFFFFLFFEKFLFFPKDFFFQFIYFNTSLVNLDKYILPLYICVGIHW